MGKLTKGKEYEQKRIYSGQKACMQSMKKVSKKNHY